jgi:uncharacterized protein (DUF362 family)
MIENYNRRMFIRKSAGAALALTGGSQLIQACNAVARTENPVVSIVRINQDRIGYAVEKAIDLLGGVETVAANKERIMLKPNLVAEDPSYTTKPSVIRALAELMKRKGRDVSIGEGSTAAAGFNVLNNKVYRTRKQEILDGMQQYVFDKSGYTELAAGMGIRLVNLHSGDMTEVSVPGGLLFDTITMHRSIQDCDLLCSVPMMKTHVLATVTLGMKNLIGLYPGTVYYAQRSWLHDHAATRNSPGVAFEILDMVRAAKPGLTVIDASMAMEGNGPADGNVLKMDVIIAGTDTLATDMVAAQVMGFKTEEIPHLAWAVKTGMTLSGPDDVEVRGESIASVAHNFARPDIVSWESVSHFSGKEEI